jgi:hypothetical protein
MPAFAAGIIARRYGGIIMNICYRSGARPGKRRRRELQ